MIFKKTQNYSQQTQLDQIQPSKRRINFAGPLILIILFGSYLWLSNTPLAGCDKPLNYSIGTVDQRFKISASDLLSSAEAAAKEWNLKSGKTILLSSKDAGLKIDMVYDDRQAKIDAVNKKLADINKSENSIGSWRDTLSTMVTNYEKDLASYNSKVDYWNAHGGAPAEIYSNLQTERTQLEQDRNKINQSAELLNSQINVHNSNLTEFKTELNQEQGKIETEGEYSAVENQIDIYTYENKDELKLVLMHEFGHALGIDHASEEKSVMYYMLSGKDVKNPQLTTEDLSMLEAECKPYRKFTRTLVQFVRNYF